MAILAFVWFLIYIINIIFEPMMVLNVISLLLWFVTVLYLFKTQTQFSFFNFMVLFGYTTTGLSCIIAEFGSYYVETQWVSYLSGATSKNLSLCFFLIYGALLGFKCIKNFIPEKYPTVDVLNVVVVRLIPVISVFVILSLLYIYSRFGSPNDYNVDRFYYWSHIAPSWGDYLKFNLVQLSFILGMIYSMRRNIIILSIFLIGLVAQVLVGEKFTGIFSSLVFFFTPYFIVHYYKFKIFSIKNIILTASVVLVFGFIIYTSYAAIVGQRNAADSFISRIILQSQMWWAVDHVSDGIKSSSEIFQSFFGMSDDEGQKGIFYLMSQITPASIFNGYYEKKINFTMASPVNFIYFFGYALSFIVVIPIGFVCGILYGFFRSAVLNYDFWIVLVFIKIHYTIVRIFTMGEMHAFTDVKFLMLCAISFLYAMFICFIKQREKRYAF